MNEPKLVAPFTRSLFTVTVLEIGFSGKYPLVSYPTKGVTSHLSRPYCALAGKLATRKVSPPSSHFIPIRIPSLQFFRPAKFTIESSCQPTNPRMHFVRFAFSFGLSSRFFSKQIEGGPPPRTAIGNRI